MSLSNYIRYLDKNPRLGSRVDQIFCPITPISPNNVEQLENILFNFFPSFLNCVKCEISTTPTGMFYKENIFLIFMPHYFNKNATISTHSRTDTKTIVLLIIASLRGYKWFVIP